MSTMCKISVIADETEIFQAISDYFCSDRSQVVQESSVWSLALTKEHFNLRDYPPKEPTLLSVKQIAEDIVDIEYNCFSEMKSFTKTLTGALLTKAVVNINQSTSGACYWAFYSDGELLREISSEHGELDENNGDKLDFESSEPGKNVAEAGEEAYFIFDHDDMDDYNRGVGIDVEVYEGSDPDWTNFRIFSEQVESNRLAGESSWSKFKRYVGLRTSPES